MCERSSRSSTRSGCQPTQCIPRTPSIGVGAGLEIASWACAWTCAGRRQSIQLHGADRVWVPRGVDNNLDQITFREDGGRDGLCSCFHLPSPTKTSRLDIRSSVCRAQCQSSFRKRWRVFFLSLRKTLTVMYQNSSSVSSGFSYGGPLRNSHGVARSPRTPEREVRWKVSMDLSPVCLRMSPSRRVGQHSEKCFGLPESGPNVFGCQWSARNVGPSGSGCCTTWSIMAIRCQ